MARTIFSLVALLAAGALFFLYTKPAYDDAREIRTQIAQYDSALQRASDLQEIKQTLVAKFNAFNPSDTGRLQKLLPDHVDNVRLILDLDNLAARHQMALQNVSVSAPQTADSSQSAIGAVGASKQKYDSLTMKFTTQGSYEQFLRFLLDLEQSLRIVDLAALTISRADVGAGASAEPLYSYEVTIKTYWLK